MGVGYASRSEVEYLTLGLVHVIDTDVHMQLVATGGVGGTSGVGVFW